MKKIMVLSLSLVLLILCSSCISAGFLDEFFGSDSGDGKDNSKEFIDIGTSNNCSSDWLILSNVSKTVYENSTIISSVGDSGVYANKPTTSMSWKDTFEWSTPFTIEFDVLNWEGTPYLRIADNNTDLTKEFAQLGITNASHVKIVSNDTSISYIVDNKNAGILKNKFNNAQIGFRLVDATVEYKNFKIY